MFNRISAIFIALLGLTGAAAAETCTLPSLADSVDLKPLPGSDLMLVPVQINGTPRQFLLNIGTNPTEVSAATVAQLGLPENAKRTENIGADSGNMVARGGNLSALTNGGLGNVSVLDVRDKIGSGGAQTRVRIGALTIGRATGKNLQFLVANDAEMGKSEPYDGLLTGDFFKQYDVELDFTGHQMNYLTPTKCTDPNQVAFWSHSDASVIPMTMADGKIQVQVVVEGHPLNAIIDTSSARTVMRRDIAELVLGFKPDTPEMMLASDLKDGLGQPVYGHTFSKIAFAGVTANNVPMLIQTNSMVRSLDSGKVLGSKASSTDARIPDLSLGMDVLHQLHLYIVYGQKNLYVTSAQ